jgi:hypothetical protein
MTIHRYECAAPDSPPMWVWVDGDGTPYLLGEMHEITELHAALTAFLATGECDAESVSEYDPAWGGSYSIIDAAHEAVDAGYAADATQMADTIRRAVYRGAIRGAVQRNGQWYLSRMAFRGWLVKSASERRGRPKLAARE